MAKGQGIIAKRYARALFESYEAKELDAKAEALRELATTWSENAELRSTLGNPAVSNVERSEVLGQLAGMLASGDELFSNFCKLLFENRRLGELPAVSATFDALLAALKKELALQITSALPLPQGEKDKIEEHAKKEFGCLVSIDWQEDSELLGGLVVKAGDTILDGSVSSSLEQIRSTLLAS